MAKHTHTTRRRADDDLGVFGHLMGLLVKGLIIEVKFGHDPLIPQKSSEHTTI